MATPNFTPGIGGLATSRYDFENHINGVSNKHDATEINMGSPETILGGATTVQSGFQFVSDYIIDQLSLATGQGFITVGDGYDTYHNAIATPNTPFDNAIPSINNALNAVLYDVNNPNYQRVRDGGVVVIKSGTYKVDATISIPPGITIMGEGFGTKLVNALSIQAPMFKIKSDGYRGFGSTTDNIVDNTPDSNFKFIVTRETRLVNLVIADNYVEPKSLGDTTYLSPNNTSAVGSDANRGLVSVEEGANFAAYGCKFLGRIAYSTPGSVISNNGITTFGINTDSTFPSTSGTSVQIRDCLFDGFAIPIKFTAGGGTNDYFTCFGSFIRGYGFLDNSNTDSNSAIIKINACNANVANNYAYGALVGVSSLLYIASAGTPVAQSFPRIELHGNNVAVNKGSGSANSIFKYMLIDSGITTPSAVFTSIEYGNNFLNSAGSSYDIAVNSSSSLPQLSVSNNGTAVKLTPSGTGSTIVLQPSGTGSTIALQSVANTNITSSSGDVVITATSGNAQLTSTSGAVSVGVSGSTLISVASAATLNSPNTTISGTLVQIIGSTGGAYLATLSGGDIHILSSSNIVIFGTIKGDNTANDPLRFGLNSVALSTSTPVTLTSAQYNTQTLKFTGAISNDINVVLPNSSGYSKLIDNTTTGNFNVLVGVSGQVSPIAFYPGQKGWIYCDGSNIVSARSLNMTIANNFVYSGGSFGTTLQSTSSSSFSDTTIGLTITGARTGDSVVISGMASGSTTGSGEIIIRVIDGSTTDLNETLIRYTTVAVLQAPFTATKSLTGSGSFTVSIKIAFRAISGTMNLVAPSSLVVQLVRPL
jgi:hypothetical protein